MKRTLFITIITLLPCTGLQAQRTLQIKAIPGQLAEQLTEEQMATVEELTLTGELCNSDFAALRSMESLRVLDMTDAQVDTIPGYGLADTDIEKISLPKALEVIESYAFSSSFHLENLHWNTFPVKIEDHAFKDSYLLSFTASGAELAILNDALYTADLKTLLLFPVENRAKDGVYTVAEGTDKIGEKAFMDCFWIYKVILPTSLGTIEDKSFWIKPSAPTNGSGSMYLLGHVTCQSTTPPVCLGDPFGIFLENAVTPQLTIPPGCEDAYKNDPYWWKFFYPTIGGSKLAELHKSPCRIQIKGSSLIVENAGTCRLCIYDIAGRCVTDCRVENNITVENLPAGMFIYRLQGSNIAENRKFIIE